MAKHARFQNTLYNRTWLETHYITMGLDSSQIGELLDCAPTTVTKCLREFDIPLRSASERKKNQQRQNKETITGTSLPRPKLKYLPTLCNDEWLKAQWLSSFDSRAIGRNAGGASATTVDRYLALLFEKHPELPRFKAAGASRKKGPNRPPRERDENAVHNAYSTMRQVVQENDLPTFCALCGDENRNQKDVNHKDRNPWNNDPENLEHLCRECHRKQHAAEAWVSIQFVLSMGLSYMDIRNVARKSLEVGLDIQKEVKASFEGYRIAKTTVLDSIPEYHSKEWLEEKYVTEGLNTYQVAKIGGCAQMTVLRRMERNDIPRRPSPSKVGTHTPRPKARFLDTLNNDAWLRANWLETYSFGEMSRRCGSSKPAVINRMKDLFKRDPSIPQKAPEGFHPPSPYAETIQNEEWLKSAWLETGNLTHIAKQVGCSPGYVHGYVKRLLEKYPELPKPMTTGERTRAAKGS